MLMAICHNEVNIMAPVKKVKSTTHEARLNFRLSNAIKERAARAAEISGQSLSDFAASAIARQADEIISRHEVIVLANEDRDFFLAVLDGDSTPSEKSMEAARRYRKGQRKGSEYHW
jgi:uncharacterized protein (DUF1778 family)